MQTPLEIDFQGMAVTPDVRDTITKHVAELEQRYGRVTACRVALKGPRGRHHTGGLYGGEYPSRASQRSGSQFGTQPPPTSDTPI